MSQYCHGCRSLSKRIDELEAQNRGLQSWADGAKLDNEGLQSKVTELEARSEWVDLLNRLVANEVNSVTIHHPNADFCGPAYAIDFQGDLSDWDTHRFEGDTQLECFEKAVVELLPESGHGE